MEEAEKMADKVVIIDRGKIIGSGTPQELKISTTTNSLEEAFLKLTGEAIRRDEASDVDKLRSHARAWGRKR
jgi:ABC-2 type transport system ATP-binding protein